MPKFSRRSLKKLETAHPDLQKIYHEVIKHVDCTIIQGVRSTEEQEELFSSGKSKTMNSKHLKQADGYSHALDVICYPIDWNDNVRNYLFAGFVKGVAASMGISIRIGADWDGDFYTKDQSFHDIVHFEID